MLILVLTFFDDLLKHVIHIRHLKRGAYLMQKCHFSEIATVYEMLNLFVIGGISATD